MEDLYLYGIWRIPAVVKKIRSFLKKMTSFFKRPPSFLKTSWSFFKCPCLLDWRLACLLTWFLLGSLSSIRHVCDI